MSGVVVAGHVCVDLIPQLPSGFVATPGALVEIGPLGMQAGGSVFNTGSALAALGVDVTAVADIGADPLGAFVAQQLHEHGVQPDLTVVTGQATSYSIVVESPTQDRAFLHHVGAAQFFTGEAISPEGVRFFHLGYPTVLPALAENEGEKLFELMKAMKDNGVTTSLDLSVIDPSSPAANLDWQTIMARVLPQVDVVSPSIDDLVSLGLADGTTIEDARRAARDLVRLGASIAFVSAGALGAALVAGNAARLTTGGGVISALDDSWAGTNEWADAEPVPGRVSTNGAGDTLTAGLIYGLLQQWSVPTVAQFGVRLAAAKVQGLSLDSALPSPAIAELPAPARASR